MGMIYNFTANGNDNWDYLDMCDKYKEYVDTHRADVYKAYETYFKMNDWTDKLPSEISVSEWEDALEDLEEEVLNHDNSKYSDEEFEPYRRHFDKTEREEILDKQDEYQAELAEAEYEKAWRHHYLINPHHPEFWNHTDIVNGQLIPLDKPREGGPRDMDLLNILHMICDWMGMSLKFRNKFSPVSWYNTQAADERRCMSPKTRHTLYLILTMMFPSEEVIE